MNLDTGLVGCEEKTCLETSILQNLVVIEQRKEYLEWYANMNYASTLEVTLEDLIHLAKHFDVNLSDKSVYIKQYDHH